MTKSKRVQHEEDRAARQAYAERTGEHHRVWHDWDGRRFDPVYFRSLEQATTHALDMVKRSTKPIPKDFYDRQAHLMTMIVHVESLAGAWSPVGEERCNCGVTYADEE